MCIKILIKPRVKKAGAGLVRTITSIQLQLFHIVRDQAPFKLSKNVMIFTD